MTFPEGSATINVLFIWSLKKADFKGFKKKINSCSSDFLFLYKAPDKQHICIFTQLKQHEYANKLICVRTKTQTKFVGT